MQIHKVKKYNAGYPKREETLKNPNLLKNAPDRWKALLASGTILSSVILASCGINSPQDLWNKIKPTPTPPLIEGVVISIPYYYIDEEAIDIIVDEFKAYGIMFDSENTKRVVAELPVDVKSIGDSMEFEYYTLTSEFIVDGTSEDLSISFEFISKEDFSKWAGQDNMYPYYSTTFLRGFLEDGKFNTKNDEIVLAFYSKHTNVDNMEKDLRKQVRDFIQMLEYQGVI
ncbi:MAG TPA: hypothetical protein GXZ66_11705 [Clostridiaceae bacterium]|jgi:hypothetical protein|nr:hypothetical protein [Clostridiaceae bacterium]HOA30609.1 hypothetical protein [Clostridia bacterium]